MSKFHLELMEGDMNFQGRLVPSILVKILTRLGTCFSCHISWFLRWLKVGYFLHCLSLKCRYVIVKTVIRASASTDCFRKFKHLIDKARQDTKQSPPTQSCRKTPQTYKQKSNCLNKTAATKSFLQHSYQKIISPIIKRCM